MTTPDPFGDALPTLDTPRLRLRTIRPADDPALFAVFGDEEALRYWSRPPFVDVDEASAYRGKIESGFASRTLFQWGVTLRETDELIGTCTLAGWEREHRRAELGYIIARPHWRKGYASEAVRAVLAFAFGPMNIHRVEADIDPANDASRRMLEKLGFSQEGHLRERWWPYGTPADSDVFGLLAPEYEAATAG
ncbi:MAG TPA: GNAT family N-acetyltransferase [Rhodothermales bacterium]|nr:GNAT family N-acetyltransferase [Rhodothermales bacterium]